MKISELIDRLGNIRRSRGDLEVVLAVEEYSQSIADVEVVKQAVLLIGG